MKVGSTKGKTTYLTGIRKDAYNTLLKKCVNSCVMNVKAIMSIFDISDYKVYTDGKKALAEAFGETVSFKELHFDTELEKVAKLWQETCQELHLDPADFNDVAIDIEEKTVSVEVPIKKKPAKKNEEPTVETPVVEEAKPAEVKQDEPSTEKEVDEQKEASTEKEEADDDFSELYKFAKSVGIKANKVSKLDTCHNLDTRVDCELFYQSHNSYKNRYIIPYSCGQSQGSKEQIMAHIERFMNDSGVISLTKKIKKDVRVYIRQDEYSIELLYMQEFCDTHGIHMELNVVTGNTANKVYENNLIKSIRIIYSDKVEKAKNSATELVEFVWASPEDPQTIAADKPMFKLTLVSLAGNETHILLCTSIEDALMYHSKLLLDKYKNGSFAGYSVYLDEITENFKRDKNITRYHASVQS